MVIKIVSGKHPYIPTPPLLYGGSELEASLTANALEEEGFDVCLDATKRSVKLWDYYFTTPPPKQCEGKPDLTISYINCFADIHVFQGRPFQCQSVKVFASEPQYNYYTMTVTDVEKLVIPNAIPEWFYQPRESWNDGDYYLFLNRCDDNKGCREFVQWCVKNNLKCKMITQFWFVKDLDYALSVVNYAKNHGIEVLLNLSPLEKIEVIRNAKAVVGFLSKNYFEGYGLWVHEANWMRVRVISTNVQAVPWTMMRGEIVEYNDGETKTIMYVNNDESKWREDRSYSAYKKRWVKLVERELEKSLRKT